MQEFPELKARLSPANSLIGVWLLSTSADNAEALAYSGIDFVIIDHEHEHGQGSVATAVNQLRAIKATGCVGIIRVPRNDPVFIKRALDTGVGAILVPNVTSAAEASRAVAAARYAPAGIRGVFAGMRATQYGFDTAYHDTANQKQAVIVQVECVAAIDHIPEIGEVEGVDVIFIGPRDLSATLGKVNQFDDPEVRAQIDRAEKMILRTGKLLGSIARNGDEARQMSERGYHLVVAGSDMSLLGNGVKAMLAQARQRPAALLSGDIASR